MSVGVAMFWHLGKRLHFEENQLMLIALQYPSSNALQLDICFGQSCYDFRIFCYPVAVSIVQASLPKCHIEQEERFRCSAPAWLCVFTDQCLPSQGIHQDKHCLNNGSRISVKRLSVDRLPHNSRLFINRVLCYFK